MTPYTLEEAIAQVSAHASEDWKKRALDTIRRICEQSETFTTDAVWEELDRTFWRTHENRAMGALMREAVKRGWCRGTGNYVASTRPVCHRRPVLIYESLVWGV